MGAVLLSPIYLLLHLYLAIRILSWFSAIGGPMGSTGFAIVFTILFTLVTISPLLGAFTRGSFKRAAKQLSNYWLGVLLYLSLFLLLSDLIRILFCLATQQPLFLFAWSSESADTVSRTAAVVGDAAVFAAAAFLSIYGILHARQVKKVTYSVKVPKSGAFSVSKNETAETMSMQNPGANTVCVCKAQGNTKLKIALVADLHLGYSVGLPQIKKIADIIREMEPDLIVFAGDLFDNEFAAIGQPEECARVLASLKSTYGSFACWGNHDVEELIFAGFTFHSKEEKVFGSPQMNEFLKVSGIRILEDETLLIDNAFYLTGRLDASCQKSNGSPGHCTKQIQHKPHISASAHTQEESTAYPQPDDSNFCRSASGKSVIGRKTPAELTAELDPKKPHIVIDHQPSELPDLAAAGVDLVLSGHTHDGQLFPASLTTRIGWKNSHGKLCIGNMTSIVTSGAGIWGPAMRVGTNNEVVEVSVSFSDKA
ncbi:MAG: metallophosphoesterase [Lachnospiraceae bacterium]|nr:metallophosphoesterase [Lachnospiraceae bacterium]